jgi:hypothetical protein
MPTSILVPHLQAKLDLLLRYDTNLTNRTALAQELGGKSAADFEVANRWADYPARRNLITGSSFREDSSNCSILARIGLRADRVDDEPQSEYVSRLEAELRIRAPPVQLAGSVFLRRPLYSRHRTGECHAIARGTVHLAARPHGARMGRT